MTVGDGTGPDRPWKRPGAFRYALGRVGGFLQPPVSVGEVPTGLLRELDVPVTVRDGTRLEVNVHRPAEPGRFPVLLSPHRTGKDQLPLRKRFGYAVPFGFRRQRQSAEISFSRMTAWAGPDPAWWVAHGYAVVNADLRGTGASDGDPRPDGNGQDIDDLVTWAARQPWSNGSVGVVLVADADAAPSRPTSPQAIASWEPATGAGVGQVRLTSATEQHRWIHRGGTWTAFYGDEALAAQRQFFERHLRDRPAPALPPVRVEVRESRDVVHEVRDEGAWPLPDTIWTSLYLSGDGLVSTPGDAGSITFVGRRGGARFDWTAPAELEICGPLTLRLAVSAAVGTTLFAGLEKWRGTEFVPFEGPFGFGRDRVAAGAASVPAVGGADVEIALGTAATLFRAGETLRLVVAARPLWPRNPLTGPYPAPRARSPRRSCTLHWGPGREAVLLVPVIRRGADPSPA